MLPKGTIILREFNMSQTDEVVEDVLRGFHYVGRDEARSLQSCSDLYETPEERIFSDEDGKDALTLDPCYWWTETDWDYERVWEIYRVEEATDHALQLVEFFKTGRNVPQEVLVKGEKLRYWANDPYYDDRWDDYWDWDSYWEEQDRYNQPEDYSCEERDYAEYDEYCDFEWNPPPEDDGPLIEEVTVTRKVVISSRRRQRTARTSLVSRQHGGEMETCYNHFSGQLIPCFGVGTIRSEIAWRRRQAVTAVVVDGKLFRVSRAS